MPASSSGCVLTTVIEADTGIGTEAQRRDASPLAQTVQRRIDASDHFHYDVVDGSFGLQPQSGTARPGSTAAQDDSDARHGPRLPAPVRA